MHRLDHVASARQTSAGENRCAHPLRRSARGIDDARHFHLRAEPTHTGGPQQRHSLSKPSSATMLRRESKPDRRSNFHTDRDEDLRKMQADPHLRGLYHSERTLRYSVRCMHRMHGPALGRAGLGADEVQLSDVSAATSWPSIPHGRA